MPFKVIPTRDCDRQACFNFLASDTLAYEHLDWLSDQERLFDEFSFALIDGNSIKAMLALSADIPQISWISFFTSLRDGKHAEYFAYLYAQALSYIKSYAVNSVFLLDLRPWMTVLAESQGFTLQDQVISLDCSPSKVPQLYLSEGIQIQPLQSTDLPAVLSLDWLSFPLQWQISARGLDKLLQNGGLHSVLLRDGQLIAYAMHSVYSAFAHLDRIAVLPNFQSQGYGKALITSQIQALLISGIVKFTVNTQGSNLPSQRLYRSLGYSETGTPVSVLGQAIR
jgi:ribosomal-protein-alanine N-acetyltransferase